MRNSIWSNPRNHDRARLILAVIEEVLGRYFSLDISDIEQIDIAEFFTVAHSLSENPALFGPVRTDLLPQYDVLSRPTPATLFDDLAAVTRTFFYDIGCLDGTSAELKSLIPVLDPEEDVLINFNWDEELDFALDRRDESIRYTARAAAQEGAFLSLKPHGSIGWYDVGQGIGNDDMYFIAHDDDRVRRVDRKIVAYYGNELPIDIDGAPHSRFRCPPVITPPTFAKRFDYLEQQIIWQDVLHVCRSAEQFVFLGYSLPKDDILTRAAIRSALRDSKRHRKRCLVVDRSFDDKRINFESVFGQGLANNRHYLHWEFGGKERDFARRLFDQLDEAKVPD